jgi:hypothetical protein
MLDRARALLKGARQKRRVTLFEGEMAGAHQAPGGPFGMVIFSLNGFLHLTTAAEQRAALVAAHKALDPRGQLLIDVFNPSLAALHGLGEGVVHEGRWRRDDGSTVDKFSSRRISSASQIIHAHIWYDLIDPTGALRRVPTQFDLRYVHRHEIELMLELAGFVEWQIYGSYELDPFDETSDRMIIAAEPSPSIAAAPD